MAILLNSPLPGSVRLRPCSHRVVLRLPCAGLGELRKRTQIDDLRRFICG
jgi:hypothetical protein